MTSQPRMEPDGELELLLSAARRKEEGASDALRMALAEDVRHLIQSCLPTLAHDASEGERREWQRQADAAEDYVWSQFERKLSGLTPYRGRIAAYVRILVTDFQAWPLAEAARNGNQDAFSRLEKLLRNRVHAAISRKIRRNPEAVQEIANDVFLKLHMKLADLEPLSGLLGGWISTVAKNKAIDYLRRQCGQAEERHRSKPEELFEQLLELASQDAVPLHFVIGFGLHEFLGLSSRTIVEQCSESSLGSLEERLRNHWPVTKSISAPDNAKFLKHLFPEGDTASKAVDRWIASARSLAEETLELRWKPDPVKSALPPVTARSTPPSPVYEKLLMLTFSGDGPPHQALCFGLNKLLTQNSEYKYSPQEIERRLGDSALHELEARLEKEYREKSGLTDKAVEEAFEGLRAQVAPGTALGESNLKSYKSESGLARDIPRWVQNVRRRTVSVMTQDEEAALRSVFSGVEAPHELLSFGFTRLLRWQPEELEHRAASKLNTLCQLMESQYQEKTELAPTTLSSCFSELRGQLETNQPGSAFQCGHTSLREYFEGDGALNIAQWRDAVQGRVYRQLVAGGKELVFWYICGYL